MTRVSFCSQYSCLTSPRGEGLAFHWPGCRYLRCEGLPPSGTTSTPTVNSTPRLNTAAVLSSWGKSGVSWGSTKKNVRFVDGVILSGNEMGGLLIYPHCTMKHTESIVLIWGRRGEGCLFQCTNHQEKTICEKYTHTHTQQNTVMTSYQCSSFSLLSVANKWIREHANFQKRLCTPQHKLTHTYTGSPNK